MMDWFAAHDGLEQFFLLCAGVGGVVVLLRLVLTIAGLDHDGSIDSPHADSDTGFKLLSIQGISAFFTLFGLVGYTMYHQAGLGNTVSLLSALVAGFLAMWLMHRIFVSMLRLQSSGSVGIEAALGAEGRVYLTVTPEGGSVQVTVANRLREYNAVCAAGDTIPSGTPVRVAQVAGQSLLVARIIAA